jgi:hypothetical protein
MTDWRKLAWLFGLMAAAVVVVVAGMYWTHAETSRLEPDCIVHAGWGC